MKIIITESQNESLLNNLIKIVKKTLKENTTGASVKKIMGDYGFVYGFPYDYFLIGGSNNPNAYSAEELSITRLETETQGEGERYANADQKAEFVVYIKPAEGKQNWDSYISLSKIDFNNKQASTLRNLFSNLKFNDKEKHRYTFEGKLPTDKVFQFVDYLKSYPNVTDVPNQDVSNVT
jgi:hypothetical protein